jgi:hypothetical protein
MPGMLDSREPTKRTVLSPQEEAKFQKEIQDTLWYWQYKHQYNEAPNLNDPMYDYRGAYVAGVQPQSYQYDKTIQHWPSVAPNGDSLKASAHPTAWMEDFQRNTGTDPLRLGLNTPEAAWNYVRDLKR